MVRKSISASTRWNVFYRDGFACRYCGAQAGEEGVEIVLDHVLSVADGGDDRIDNLATACKRCNGGKGAKSLRDVPTSEDVVRRVKDRRRRLTTIKRQIKSVIDAQAELRQQIVNLKCEAYGTSSTILQHGEAVRVTGLIQNSDHARSWSGTHRASVNLRNEEKNRSLPLRLCQKGSEAG